jgi:hypothetical protein
MVGILAGKDLAESGQYSSPQQEIHGYHVRDEGQDEKELD